MPDRFGARDAEISVLKKADDFFCAKVLWILEEYLNLRTL
jgi:hypothetical protein